MPEEEPTAEEKKEEVRENRGVGIAKAHVYLEDGIVNVSVSDYFEGETVTIAAVALNRDDEGTFVEGDAVEGTAGDAKNGGRIANSDLTLSKRDYSYELGEHDGLRVKIAYAGTELSADIHAGNRRAWLDWTT